MANTPIIAALVLIGFSLLISFCIALVLKAGWQAAKGSNAREPEARPDGFFAKHPIITMNLVSVLFFVATGGWVISALRSGAGTRGVTLLTSPVQFWAEVAVMSGFAVLAAIAVIRTVGQTLIRWR
jgi:uncharacterized membrane protein YjgN (DUF898 family)